MTEENEERRKIRPFKDKALQLLSMTPVARAQNGLPLSLQEVAIYCHISLQSIYRYTNERRELMAINRAEEIRKGKVWKEEQVKRLAEEARGRGEVPEDPNYNSESYLASRSCVADQALMKACDAGNANALRTYYQLTKRLVEKQEVTHKIDGSFFARAVLQAERELAGGEATNRVVEVQKEPDLLRPELCLPSGQGKGKDSQVRDLASLVEGNRPSSDQENDNNSQGQTIRD